MLEAIITYLNLKLGLLNYFEQQHCLCELKSDNEGKVSPVEYVGDGNYTVINYDEFDGVSYWRLRDKPTQDVLETKYQAGKRVEVKIPLRLVFSVRRTKLTTDDAYAFDRIRQTVVSQFNIDDGILKTTLGCEKVTVSIPTSNGNAKEVWDDETSETGTFEPTYAMVYGSIDIEVSVIYAGSCLPTECDDIDTNILHAFDFCKSSVVAQLTPEQIACLEEQLCEVPPTLCEQLADVLPEDVVVDVFDCLTETAQAELLDSECVIPPCDPVTEQINGTTIGTTPSGGTNSQLIRNTAGTAVGTAANPSLVADATYTLKKSGGATINTGSIAAEASANITAPDANVLLNGAPYGSVESGGTIDVIGGASAALSVVASNTTPAFGGTITITATPTGFVPTLYRFYAQGAGDTIFIGTSLTNSISWKVVAPHGSMSIYAEATDGAGASAYTDTPQVITVTGALFDAFPTATLGFSMKQRAYRFFGPLFRIRRSSDNTMAVFGFVDGELDTASILAFCGSGDGLAVQWWGQSADRNIAYQSTANSQPKIVSAGVMVTASDGNPALDFDGSNDFMTLLNAASFVTGFFSFQNDATGTNLLQEIIGGTGIAQVYSGGSVVTGAGASDSIGGGVPSSVKDTSRHVMSVMTASNDGVYIDGSNITLGTLATITDLTLIGNRVGQSFWMNGKVQDIIGFPDDQFANRTTIEAYLT